MAKDEETKVHELKQKVKDFCDARDWEQFHDAKELAIALSIEVSELLEHFRWKSKEEVNHRFTIPEKREEIEDELSDILFFVLRIAQMYDINLSSSLNRKIKKNDEKYPVEKARGSHKKYNEL
ncbi:MAG: nucleotide pyrophosphohydrolase [Nanoarchaeota archaeon]|nr:nucleotide pyrophosphohydrolase [Nanoarchaeota archaeon]